MSPSVKRLLEPGAVVFLPPAPKEVRGVGKVPPGPSLSLRWFGSHGNVGPSYSPVIQTDHRYLPVMQFALVP